MVDQIKPTDTTLKFLYKNYKGTYKELTVVPKDIAFKNSKWHGECWVMIAYDVDKGEDRAYKMQDIIKWL